MSKQMVATFSDSAFNALQNEDAVFNNGFRSIKGYYYPEQPVFSPMPEYTVLSGLSISSMLGMGACVLGIGVCGYFLFGIALPMAKRFSEEKIYPYLAERWDERHESKENVENYKKQSTISNEAYTRNAVGDNKIVCFNDFSRSA